MMRVFETSPISFLGGLAARVWRVFRNRRQLVRLSDLSDAQLADIGLSRSDVRWVRNMPDKVDATAVLMKLARERSMAAKIESQAIQPDQPALASDAAHVDEGQITPAFTSQTAKIAA